MSSSTMFNIAVLIVFVSLLLPGCGSDPEKPEPSEPPKTLVKAKITVSGQVNPDINGRPSPIVMRIYELKNMGKFEDADFYKLSNDYASVLGEDLTASEKFHLRPGDVKTVTNETASETKYFAVTAGYRDLDQAVWRGSIPLEAAKTNAFEIALDRLSIHITVHQPAQNKTNEPVK